MNNITRRNTLQLISAGLIASASYSILPRKAAAAGTITVLNWQGYGTDEAWSVKAFTEKDRHRGRSRLLQLGSGNADQAAHQSRRL